MGGSLRAAFCLGVFGPENTYCAGMYAPEPIVPLEGAVASTRGAPGAWVSAQGGGLCVRPRSFFKGAAQYRSLGEL